MSVTVELWPVGRLNANPKNYRRHPERQVADLRASLRRWGWRKVSISARPSDGQMMKGHGVLAAAVLEGMAEVPVLPYECSDAEASAWLVADNELSRPELVDDDRAALAGLLAEINASGGLEGNGWNLDELETLCADLDAEIAAASEPEIRRERTAIARTSLSLPVAALARLGYLEAGVTLLDYGSGRGDDVERLVAMGVKAKGWDPHFAPDVRRGKAQIVNLGYVVNVIEDVQERAETLRRAGRLARKILAVAALIGSPEAKHRPWGDGVITSAGTFQHYFPTQSDLVAWVSETLGRAAESIEPGVVFVPSDEAAAADLAERRRRLEVADRQDEITEDRAMALSRKWGTQAGQRWRAGRHLVLCGDSFDLLPRALGGQLADLILTDPPFAIYGSSTGIGASIADAHMVQPFFRQVFGLLRDNLRWFGHSYVCADWRSWGPLWTAAQSERVACKNMLVWDKGGGLGSMYGNAHELIGFYVREPPDKAMTSRRETGHRPVHRMNILRGFTRPSGDDRQHNAAKPVAMLAELINNSTDAGDLVLDPFCGSGSTLLACEQTGRRCLTIDVEPRWVAVALERWAELTGQTPSLEPEG